MTLVILALGWGGCLFLALRGWHKRRLNLWLLVPLLVATLYSTNHEIKVRTLEGKLSSVASVLAGRDAHVTCERWFTGLLLGGHYRGWVPYEDGDERGTSQTIFLRDDICATIRDALAEGFDTRNVELAASIHVLTHEAAHVAGEINEAAAECIAVQNNVRSAMLLGATEPAARSLSLAYWQEIYPRMPNAYRSKECDRGRGMDNGSSDSPWNLSHTG